MLESEGIGRPSTYASIIGTICDRGYVQLINNALIPTFTAFAVTSLLEEHFPNLVDPSFTSKMEQTLDDISTGSVEWLPYLKKFYSGEEGLSGQVKSRDSLIDGESARTVRLEGLDDAVKVKIGKFGAYIQVGEGDRMVNSSIPQNLTPSDLVPEKIELLLKQKLEGPDQVGIHPELNEPIFMMMGQYGPYVQLGQATDAVPKPKRASLPKGMQPENVTVEIAVKLLALPRTLGEHPDTGNRVFVNTGRFGPYVCHVKGNGDKDDNRSLKSTDDPYSITFERGLELLAQPKTLRGASAAKVLKSLGKHPNDDEAIEILDGKYGAYVKHGKVNVSLTKEQTVEGLTLEEALSMLASKSGKAGKGVGKNTSKRSKSADADETKKTTTKKATAKSAVKSTTTKTGSKATAKAKTTSKTAAKATTPKTSATATSKK
jgi:DNA topoisomerase-1